jgi:ABC-type nitrate/sulfonate/bicarbonate transport system ATPase subunit
MEAGTPGHGAMLRAKDVTIYYWLERSNSAFLAVDGVNLGVNEGEFLAIVGPSGCGKSAFLNAVDGLLPIFGGSLTLNGRAIDRPGRSGHGVPATESAAVANRDGQRRVRPRIAGPADGRSA